MALWVGGSLNAGRLVFETISGMFQMLYIEDRARRARTLWYKPPDSHWHSRPKYDHRSGGYDAAAADALETADIVDAETAN